MSNCEEAWNLYEESVGLPDLDEGSAEAAEGERAPVHVEHCSVT